MRIIKRITRLRHKKELPKDTGLWINIERNPTKLGKRYVAKLYKEGKLIATYPANQISDILHPNLLQTWKELT